MEWKEDQEKGEMSAHSQNSTLITFTSLWKCHSWVTLPVPSSRAEEDFEWQWCSYTIVVHIWAASLSGDIWQGGFSEMSIHWGLSWLHGADSVKVITAASNTYRLMLFLKYKGSSIIKEIPGHDLGLLFIWFDPCSCVCRSWIVPGLVGCVQRIVWNDIFYQGWDHCCQYHRGLLHLCAGLSS